MTATLLTQVQILYRTPKTFCWCGGMVYTGGLSPPGYCSRASSSLAASTKYRNMAQSGRAHRLGR